MYFLTHDIQSHTHWNKGKLIGQKPPLKLQEVWSIRIRLQLVNKVRDLALFNLAIDSKLRSSDLVRLRVKDISSGSSIGKRAMVMQRKTQQPVQLEITEQTRTAIESLISRCRFENHDYLFKSRFRTSEHLSTRQYARIVKQWVSGIGLDSGAYGTHSLR